MAENRERLRPIIEFILFLGHQSIPIRGILNTSTTTSSVNDEGNFRKLLIIIIRIIILKKHLETCNSKAT